MIKVICLENATSIVDMNGKKPAIVNSGEIYECMMFTFDNLYCRIYTENSHGIFKKNNFISLAEWREQQIKTVLDD